MAKNNGDIPAATRGERGKQVKYSDSDLELVRSATSEGMTAPQIINRYQDRGWRLRAVRRWAEGIKNGGEMTTKRSAGGGRKMKNPGLETQIQGMLNADGQTISANVRGLARKLDVPRHQARYVLKKKLCLKSAAKVKGARMTEKNRSNRLVNATAILGMMEKKTNPLSLRSIWFSDEKIFTAEPKSQGTRNDRVLIPSNMRKGDVSASVIMKGVTAHPVSLMVGRRVSLQGRIQPHFAPKGVYINGDYYREHMLAGCYYPQIKLAAGDEHFAFQQDQAKPHCAPQNQAWLNRHMKGWLKPWMNKGAD